VNLERALKLGDRLGGHLVTGHVDGVGTVVSIERAADHRGIRVELPADLMRHVAERGSIAIDGVSLTVAETGRRSVTVSLIPETLSSTIAGSYRVGTPVNVETDIMAKYVEAASRPREGHEGSGGGLTIERLKELGFKGR
jgi:riboflavin synthase